MLSHSALTFPKYEDISLFGGLPRDMLIFILEIYFGKRFYIRGTEAYYRYTAFIYRMPIYFQVNYTIARLYTHDELVRYKWFYHPPKTNVLLDLPDIPVSVPITRKSQKQGRIYAKLDFDRTEPHIRTRNILRNKNPVKTRLVGRKRKRKIKHNRERFIDYEGRVISTCFQLRTIGIQLTRKQLQTNCYGMYNRYKY